MKTLLKAHQALPTLSTLAALLCLAPVAAQGRVLVSTNSTWRYFKGISEASTPTNAWRELDFDDSSWLAGLAPFHFGTNAAGGDDGQMSGTILDDMRGNYTCVFLRQQFVIDDTNQLQSLWLTAWYDDGFAVWINGQPPRNSVGMAGNGLAYTNTASSTSREANTRTRLDISSAFGLLRNGTNVLCLQAFNGHLTNDDFRLDVELAEATPTLNFAVASITLAEDAGQVLLRVLRTGGLDAVTVDFATTNGTAVGGQDYLATNGTLTFAQGQSEQTIVVAIVNDGMPESTESFQVRLSNPGGGAVLGSVANASVSIQDNDKGLQFELTSYSVNEDAGAVRIRVLRGDDGGFPASVDYATTDLTATAGLDYLPSVGTLTFQSGEAIQYLTLPLVNDAVREAAEAFRVTLSNPTGGTVLGTPSTTAVTITDTDEVVQLGSASYQTPEDAAFVQIDLVRGESQSAGAVDLATANGTATAGLDYEGVTNTIQFAAGERRKLVNVPILNDGLKEANETFSLTLNNPTGAAVLGSRRTAVVTIADNDPGISFERNAATVWENWGVAKINVLRGNDQILGACTVNYRTTDGSARAGVDYEAVSGTIEFKANETIRSVTIPLLAAPSSGAKLFMVLLSNATGGIPLGTAATSISISNASPGRAYPLTPSWDARLKIGREDGLNILTWDRTGSLLQADQVQGPWADHPGGRSPYPSRSLLPTRFYQIRSARPTKVCVPSRYDGQAPLPLLVVLHGYGSDAAWMEGYFRFQSTAESRGVLLCYPEGTLDSGGARYWNATDACCDFYGGGEDDSAYLRAVIEDIVRRFAVDRKRIYFTGLSNGGYMSHRMACDHADLVAGIAAFAGVTFLDPISHRPNQPVQVLHIHGTADEVVPYGGGALIGLPVTALFPGAVKTVQIWAQFNGCQGAVADPTPTLDLTLDVAGLDTTILRYTNAPPGGAAELWTINGGRHVPNLSSDFAPRVMDWLLAHPKP